MVRGRKQDKVKSADLKTRVMAAYLRRQLEGRVLPHVLAGIHDDDLVAQHTKHSAVKMAHAGEKKYAKIFSNKATVEMR
jgi:hypothetical protein